MILGAIALLRSPIFKVGALVVAAGGFYLWAHHRGQEASRLEFQQATEAEVKRQTAGIQEALERAEDRAEVARAEAEATAAAVKQAISTARGSPVARQVCLTKDMTDALRQIK